MEKHNTQEEADKTLDVANRWPNPDLDEFFFTRLKARMESQVTDTWTRMAMVLAGFKFKIALAVLILFNIYTGYTLGTKSADSNIPSEIASETDDFYNYNSINYTY